MAYVRPEFCGALVTIHPRPHMQTQVIRAGAAHSRPSPDLALRAREAHDEQKMKVERKIRHFQGFKTGNLTAFLVDVFTPNSHPIGQTLVMAGLPGDLGQFVKITNYSAQPHLIPVMTNYLLPVRPSEDGSTQLSKSLLAMFSINDNIKPSHLHLPPTYMFEGFGEQFHTLGFEYWTDLANPTEAFIT
ncbi:hypothetical protein PILCRDRAFT_617935 [Piloderma croceum F 1598]|uniref:Uncharacterized protein n=1 Tax=Piloderma croceum (strain F 1598) TaxID=765440 RepID=A0A0C3EZH1_PILCF|nr:hypothetical protein PILCRDRAFT_15300 [Piloderma croceum F 1598]KIM77550.1 hypothetical protein PILCRDRAFT_617935 [Piloderma croceum F 1598]